MREVVRRTIAAHQMLPQGGQVLAAVSGGADSVALLLVLRELGYAVRVCHVHHGLRGAEADRDAAFVRALCARLEVPFVLRRVDVNGRAAADGTGVEEAARRARYEALLDEADGLPVATAHTADDNLETMLFHLVRGTGAQGMAGIPPVRADGVIRPLLAVTRAQVEDYLAACGQPYVTDSTNASDDYTRNRLRHAVVPVLRTLNPACAAAAGRLAGQLRQDQDYLAGQAETLLASAVCPEGWRCTPLREAHPAVRTRALRQLLLAGGVPAHELNARHIAAAEGLLTHRGVIDLPGRIRLWQEDGTLGLRPCPDRTPVRLGDGYHARPWPDCMILTVRRRKSGQVFNNTFNTFFADCDTIDFGTLHARAPLPADRLILPGQRGTRTLKRLMTDLRIPCSMRDALPVIADKNGPIAVQGVGIDARRMAQNGAEVLEIAFEG